MGILFESSTPIEYLVRDALIKEKIEFQEQYRIYSGGKFSDVKYVADFYIINDEYKVLIECDGFHYHAGKDKYKKQVERDKWLMECGYIVLHFSTKSIVSNMSGVIHTIKYYLKLPCDLTKIIQTAKKPIPPPKKKLQGSSDNSFDVILYCFYKQFTNSICITYKYKSVVHNQWSDERIKICQNVPENMLETTAIYLAMLDLKRPVKLKIYYSGSLYHDEFNVSKKFRNLITNFKQGKELLNAHTIATSYVGFHGDWRRSKKEYQETLKVLRSRCFQICENEEKQCEVFVEQYANLFLEQNQKNHT